MKIIAVVLIAMVFLVLLRFLIGARQLTCAEFFPFLFGGTFSIHDVVILAMLMLTLRAVVCLLRRPRDEDDK